MEYQKIPAVYISVRVTANKKNVKGENRRKKIILCLTVSKKVDEEILDFKNKYGVSNQPSFYQKRIGFLLRSKTLDLQGKRDLIYDTHPHAKYLI